MSGDKGVGTFLLKVVVMVAHLDTRATVTQVRTKLSSLDKTMKDMDSDIEKFNDHVFTLATKLQSRGEATHDLFVNCSRATRHVRMLSLLITSRRRKTTTKQVGMSLMNN